MQPVDTSASRYDGKTMFFHWAIAIMVVVQWLGAQTIDWFPRGALRVDARSVHIVGGVLVAALLIGRIAWRLTGGRRLPPADKDAKNIAAKGTQWAMYIALVSMVTLGLVLVWVRGDSIFNAFSIPKYPSADDGLPDDVQGWHATFGWAILALAGIHAGAALIHRYVWHDGVLARMLPGRP